MANTFTHLLRTAFSRRYRWITLGLLTLLLRVAGIFWPLAIWTAYFPVFQALRWLQATALNWIPFSLAYLLLPALLGWILWPLFQPAQLVKAPASLGQRLLGKLRRLGAVLGALFFFFHILWGFNYLHNPLAAVMPPLRSGMTTDELCYEVEWAARNAEAARRACAGMRTDSLDASFLPADLGADMAEAVTVALDRMALPQCKSGSAKRIFPEGFLLRLGIAGIYNPFTGEGNLDAALVPPLQPAIMAHELSHSKGYTDEGSCNFIGILACMLHQNPFYRYSGYLAYYQYVNGDLYQADPLLARMLRKSMDIGVQADLRASYFVSLRYSGWLSDVGEKVNHTYLRTQGIQGGIVNYNRVVTYMLSWPGRNALLPPRFSPYDTFPSADPSIP
jgi:hypothetical protein